MPGPKYNYFNIRDNLNIVNYSGSISFGDSDLYISSSADGTLDIGANTGLNLNASTTLPTGKNLTITDGTVNLGTGALTLGGDVTLSTGKNLNYATNDGAAASGLQGSQIFSGATNAMPANYPSAQGWIRVDIGAMQGYVAVYSGNMLNTGR
jgi:hypothetical protein